jgi:hypothetical protein
MQIALSILQLLYDVGIYMKQDCADVGDIRKHSNVIMHHCCNDLKQVESLTFDIE